MNPEGQKVFSLLTENKSKIYAYKKEPVTLDAEYENQFKKNKLA